ncbi:MAG: hypothetical protein AB9891_15090 [Anaerolineaceae bacterium]
MQRKIHPSHNTSLVFGIIALLTLVAASLACASTSKTPVVYDDKSTLLNDCPTLQADEKTVSVSGELSIRRDETTCVSTSDLGTADRCELFLYMQDSGGLDIWMPVGIKNGMDELPDLLGYNPWDLVVHGDNGERLGDGDQVTVVLEPFIQTENETETCGFLVKTVEAAKMESSGDQPMEGKVDVEFPIDQPWYDTGIRVQKGQQILISDVVGLCNMQGSNPAWEGPNTLSGLRDFVCDTNCVINGANYGKLVARIGDGTPFLISDEFIFYAQFIAQTNGTLYFTLNDCQDCYGDNEGTYLLTLELSTP